MHGRTRSTLLGHGFTTDLIDKIDKNNYTVELLRAASKAKLGENFTQDEIRAIKAKIERTPISEVVVEEVLRKSRGCCCYCDNGDSSQPCQLHHVVMHSLTQDNSEENLLLVCPTHHVVIHENRIPAEQQKSTRWAWYSTVEMSREYESKGLTFPFGAFSPLDFNLPPIPAELIQFGPLSPGTALICYPEDLAAKSIEVLEKAGFLLVVGRSGSGKSTYVLAVSGLHSKQGYSIFRYRFDKTKSNPMKEISSFVSHCVRKTVVVVDDANAWATATDIAEIAKLISKQSNVRLVTTWTNDDSEDAYKLSTSDVPKQPLTWIDLKPAVINGLLKHEGEIVQALQDYESADKARPLGFGLFDVSLEDRIRSVGDKPNTVYEFIFSLRGDNIAVGNEFQQLFDEDRSDLPVLVAAIEQIAGFEKAVTEEEVLAECNRVGSVDGLPLATARWVRSVLSKQVERRKLIKVRDHFTTIHRKWAAKFIAAGLALPKARRVTEDLVRSCFDTSTEHPERLLRMRSWLGSVDESRPFIREWDKSLSQDDWTNLAKTCCDKGLESIAFLASEMHLLGSGPMWTKVVETSFEAIKTPLTKLIYEASSAQLYSLKELSITLEHAARPLWTEILRNWDRESVARLLMGCRADQFDNAWSTFGKARELCPGWLLEVGGHVPWDKFQKILRSSEPGDTHTVCDVFEWLPVLKPEIKRSQMRTFAEAIGESLRTATLENIREPIVDVNIVMLCLYFPNDARAAFEKLDVEVIGKQLAQSLPRNWRKLFQFVGWGEICGSDIALKIIQNINPIQMEDQIRKYGLTSLYELRVLLHFLASGPLQMRENLAEGIKDVVRKACMPKDTIGEPQSIMQAFVHLEPVAGKALAAELGYELAIESEEDSTEEFKTDQQELIEKFGALDAQGSDYNLELYSHSTN